MIRKFTITALLTLATMSLFEDRLPADEPVNETGMQLKEPEVSFERRQFSVGRHKGKVLFDGLSFPTDKQFLLWARTLKGTGTYTYDEVIRIAEDGSMVSKPLVFFDKDQRSELDTGWHTWLDKRQAEVEGPISFDWLRKGRRSSISSRLNCNSCKPKHYKLKLLPRKDQHNHSLLSVAQQTYGKLNWSQLEVWADAPVFHTVSVVSRMEHSLLEYRLFPTTAS